ncbi:MAG: hypothetical protein WDN30_11500 [Pararobbsia sp.]
MKKMSVVLAVSLLSITGIAAAQSDGITVSNDPAKIADVEQRAQSLQDMQDKQAAMKMEAPHKKHHRPKAAAAGATQ